MKSLRELLPRVSQSVIEANPQLCVKDPKNSDSNAILAARNGKRKGMNATEREYAMILEQMKRAGEIRDYLFHPLSLPWAGMKYTPDFMITPNSGLEKRRMIEVKGPHIHYRQQAVVRFKGARAHWPEFTFEMWQRGKDKQWNQIMM